MNNTMIVSSSPHLQHANTTRGIMLDVIISLVPALIAATVFFGWIVPLVTAVTTAACVFAEWCTRKILKRDNTISDLSAADLPGYSANKYDVEMEECEKRANRRAANTAVQIVRNTVGGYASCVPVSQNVRLRRGRVKYALMPVWMLATRWHGKTFLFSMNGQTGKLIGDLPVAKDLYWSWFARIALPIAGVIAALLFL